MSLLTSYEILPAAKAPTWGSRFRSNLFHVNDTLAVLHCLKPIFQSFYFLIQFVWLYLANLPSDFHISSQLYGLLHFSQKV